FNAMSIDTDTSTSDTVVLMANGLAGTVNQREFEAGLLKVSEHLTRELARSGEGATKLITVNVTGAKNTVQGTRVAKSVVNSPLVKTAVYGCDPNWGRVIMAVGENFYPSIESRRGTIPFGGTHVFQKRLARRLRSRSPAKIPGPTRSHDQRRPRHRQSFRACMGLRSD